MSQIGAGAPLGNQNGARGKDWREAIKLALGRKGEGDYRKALTAVAETVVTAALAGDKDAWKEIGDRLDGKPSQAIIGGAEDDNPVRLLARIERVIIDPKNSDR